jgi:probable F420-dependent oxidoreductase
MDFGLILPSIGDAATRDGIEAAAGLAEEHGFSDVWGTDHLLVDHSAAEDYGRTYEIVTTLAWVAGRFRWVGVGASVIIAPMRNAVVLAKELATLDDLSGGRVIAGFGVGWSVPEFANLGVEDRFRQRGAYLDETIRLCRHLWSGSSEPFEGGFHHFDDYVFGPLPARGAEVPIWIGGRNEKALERVGRLADGYHSSATSPAAYLERIPVIRNAAAAAGRPMPRLSARVRIELDQPASEDYYALHGGPEDVAEQLRQYAEIGVDHVALSFPEREPEDRRRSVERFTAEVRPLL